MKVQPGRSGRLGRTLGGEGALPEQDAKSKPSLSANCTLYHSLKDERQLRESSWQHFDLPRLQKQAEHRPRPFEDQEVRNVEET